MYKIIKKIKLAPSVFMMELEAPRIAKSAKPGQFLVLRINEYGERIPLTICESNIYRGTVTIVLQVIGKSTEQLTYLKEEDNLSDIVGPLGQPSDLVNMSIEKLRQEKFLFIAGGIGAAPIYPQLKWLCSRGIEADVILGAKAKENLILQEEIYHLSRSFYTCTEDGSMGFKGYVTDKLKELINSKKYTYCIAIGPLIMMKKVCYYTKQAGIKTIVSLNPIMLDGTGMCGACRVTINGEIKFACVDGPEFLGDLVDFDEAIKRQLIFKSEEERAKLKIIEDDKFSAKQCNSMGGEKYGQI